MSSILATLFVLALLVLMALAGYRDGLFFSTYALVRNFIGFLCAMTFSDKLAGMIGSVVTDNEVAMRYFLVVSFVLIFGGVFLLGRWLKITYTVPQVPAMLLVDRITGPIVSVMNAVVVTGTVLIVVSMLPFARFLPGDLGRFQVRAGALDTGSAMLSVFNHVEGAMGGGKYFLLEDEKLQRDANGNGRGDLGDEFLDPNGNEKWDRGRLWEYRTFCEILPDDLPPAYVE